MLSASPVTCAWVVGCAAHLMSPSMSTCTATGRKAWLLLT